MEPGALKALLGELHQAMPEAERRTGELTRRLSVGAERLAALLQRLELMRASLDQPGALLVEAIVRLGQTSVGADERLGRAGEGLAARAAGWVASRAAGQAVIETGRDEVAQAADALGQRLREAREVLSTTHAELSQRAAAFLQINDLARQRIDAAIDVALEEAAALRDEAHRAEGLLQERLQQLAAASHEHQQRGLASARATSGGFAEASERLATQIERVRDDLVRSATLDMTAEIRRALLEEAGPALESARLSTEDALAGMQRGVGELRETATAVRTTLAPLTQELDHLVDALGDTVDFIRDAAHAAGCPF